MNLLTKIGINAVALWAATFLVSGITISGPNGNAGTVAQIVTLIVVAIIFGLVNAVIKPILKVVSLPLTILSLGLFTFVINALVLQITSWITGATSLSFYIEDFFWDAILGAVIVSIVSIVLNQVIPED